MKVERWYYLRQTHKFPKLFGLSGPLFPIPLILGTNYVMARDQSSSAARLKYFITPGR